MKSVSRRHFLVSTTLAGAAFGIAGCRTTTAASPQVVPARVFGANDEIRVAVIGFRSQGGGHINTLRKMKGVRLTALCDVDRKVLDGKAKDLAKEHPGLETYTDIRKLLESKNVDAVSIATPNHWHALAAIWAVQAGKDVYVEKPVSHNVWEGRQLVAAARACNRIVQTGTQCRSSAGLHAAVEFVRSGQLGKIKVSRGFCYKPRKSIGKTSGPQAVPENIDYDLWCGPAPSDPPRRNGKNGPVHYDWHWFWNYGGGDIGNQGIHQVDICRWFLGEPQLAPSVMSVGGRLGYDDDGETPNTLIVMQNYEKAPLIFEVRGLPSDKQYREKGWDDHMDNYKGARVGCVIECEGGYVVVPDYSSATVYDKDGKPVRKFTGKGDEIQGLPGLSADSGGHHGNWIAAVRSRKVGDLHADVLEGHLSSALCHTGNISYRVGSKKKPGEIKERVKDQPGLVEAYDRMAAHLGANGIDIEKDPLTLGLPLKIDPKSETVIGNDDAAKLVKRAGRAPFTIPEKF